MSNKFNETETKKYNVFTDINFVKNTNVNNNYSECIDQAKNVSNSLNNFIDLLDYPSVKSDTSLPKKNTSSINLKKDRKNKSMSSICIWKPEKLFHYSTKNIREKPKNNNYSCICINKGEKRKIHFRPSESIIIKNNNKIFNESNIKYKKDLSKSHSTSAFIAKKLRKEESNYNTAKHSLKKYFSSNSSTIYKKYNNSMLLLNNRKTMTKSVKSHQKINDYFQKSTKYSYCTNNTSRNFSNTLYKTNSNLVIDNVNYKQLKPKFLKQLLNDSKNIKNAYKKELYNVNLKSNTKHLIEFVKKEMKKKDPEYYKKQLFSNIIKKKKTIETANKMREEIKSKVVYFGPGNLDNKVYIRKKNANLIRFSDAICHMKDIQFYQYKKILKDLYPNLSKLAFKNKYEIPIKNIVNEKKLADNDEKINKLFSLIKKH